VVLDSGEQRARDNKSAHLDRIIRTPSQPCQPPSPSRVLQA